MFIVGALAMFPNKKKWFVIIIYKTKGKEWEEINLDSKNSH